MTAPPEPTVHQAIGKIISEMEGVGKNQRNKEQGYNFRGVDDVLKVSHPLLGKHGVFIVPYVLEREVEERVAKSGAKGYCTHLHVEFTVYGPQGDSFTASTWGEGLDYGDKSTNKAMTAAFKYLIFEIFAVCDPEDDGDHESPEAGDAQPRQARQTRTRSAPAAPVAAPADGSAPEPRMVSEGQLGFMANLFKQKGFPDDSTVRHTYQEAVVGHPVAASNKLTMAEARAVITALQAEEDAVELPED